MSKLRQDTKSSLVKGGSAQDVLHRENGHVPDFLANAVGAVVVDKEPLQPLRRNVHRDALRIPAGARHFNRCAVQVRPKKLRLQTPVGICPCIPGEAWLN